MFLKRVVDRIRAIAATSVDWRLVIPMTDELPSLLTLLAVGRGTADESLDFMGSGTGAIIARVAHLAAVVA